MKIFLIGFPGSGKSFLGRAVAKDLGYPFLDSDAEIENEAGESITSIFEKEGEERFRKKEAAFIRSLSRKRNAIIATGGGLPCYHDTMHWMNENGITVYLEATAAFLFHRLVAEKQNRPLIATLSDVELMIYITETLANRRVFYESAKVKVNAEKISHSQLTTTLRKMLKKIE